MNRVAKNNSEDKKMPEVTGRNTSGWGLVILQTLFKASLQTTITGGKNNSSLWICQYRRTKI
jgi:hypothetical protein